ncbi:hypothetical protein FA13DRAFT_1402892 [Coprinellus micaceus]|uniref:Arrestin-like N-terminal domain-containing protein n=1 Tax=Coprinellus micaceus TaxID=71717 RepID=A0A4Y7SPL2_COPMI|nr:hypothetical protein FA13DRAFT_1402892 [Coprinellus micaceus]
MSRPRPQTYPPGTNGTHPTQNARPAFTHPPPEYATLSVSTLPEYPSAEELDISNEVAGRTYGGASRPRRPRRTFVFKLGSTNASSSSSAQSWLSMRLMSNAPVSAQRPRYIGGEDVEGSVILNFEKPQTVSSVSVMVRGRVVTSSVADGSHVFLEHVHSLWRHDRGESPPSVTVSDGAPTAEIVKGKLRGKFEWPFSFPFPKDFPYFGKRKGSGETLFTTPQTLMERGVNATIIYEVIVKVISGLFRNKHKIIANVLYVPSLISPELPILRCEAYRTGLYLCSPLEDPDGWAALKPLNIRISARRTEGSSNYTKIEAITATCTVYVAKPTTYTRGTLIPCYIVCQNTNPDPNQPNHLLRTFAGQECVSLRLKRRLVYFRDARQGASVVARDPTAVSSGKYAGLDDMCDETKKVGPSAVWWSPRGAGSGEYAARANVVTLEGEMHLDGDLLPSCDVPFLLVSYTVSVDLSQSQELLVECIQDASNGSPSPPSSPVTPTSRRTSRFTRSVDLRDKQGLSKCDVSLPVTIVTVKASGPHPIGYMPRAVVQKPDRSEVQEVEYIAPLTHWN